MKWARWSVEETLLRFCYGMSPVARYEWLLRSDTKSAGNPHGSSRSTATDDPLRTDTVAVSRSTPPLGGATRYGRPNFRANSRHCRPTDRTRCNRCLT